MDEKTIHAHNLRIIGKVIAGKMMFRLSSLVSSTHFLFPQALEATHLYTFSDKNSAMNSLIRSHLSRFYIADEAKYMDMFYERRYKLFSFLCYLFITFITFLTVFNSSLDLLVLRPRGSHRHLRVQHPYTLPNEVTTSESISFSSKCIHNFPALVTLPVHLASHSFTYCIINTSTHLSLSTHPLILALYLPFEMNKPLFHRHIHIPSHTHHYPHCIANNNHVAIVLNR